MCIQFKPLLVSFSYRVAFVKSIMMNFNVKGLNTASNLPTEQAYPLRLYLAWGKAKALVKERGLASGCQKGGVIFLKEREVNSVAFCEQQLLFLIIPIVSYSLSYFSMFSTHPCLIMVNYLTQF